MKKILALLLLFVTYHSHAATERISVGLGGAEANGGSRVKDITPDGRFVVFTSLASNLVTGDNNNVEDVFVYVRDTGTIERVSLSSLGDEGNASSDSASISDDGRYVCFGSNATNLVVGDSNGVSDIFVRDRNTSSTSIVSVGGISDPGNGASRFGTISGNGLFVVFESTASNLVANDTNGVKDIFRRDLAGLITTRVSVADNESELVEESQYASISADGVVVVFQTDAAIAAGDTNFSSDAYLRHTGNGTTTRVSVGPAGQQSSGFANFPDVSADGNLVVFSSRSTTFGLATEQTRIYLKNVATGALEHVSLSATGFDGSNDSEGPTISPNGRYVGFSSLATNLVAGDNNGVDDLFARDRTAVTTVRASLTSTGAQSNGPNFAYFAVPFFLANDGTYAFHSAAGDLVPGDSAGFPDVFLGQVPAGNPPVVTPSPANTALIAKYQAEIKKLTKQIKAAKKKKATATVKRLTKALKKAKALLAAL